MINLKSILVIIVFIFSGLVYSQSIQFFREKIEVDVNGSFCQIKGIYYFKNSSNKEVSRTFYYPFVVNEKMLYPDSIIIKDLGNDRIINFSTSKSGIHFRAHLPAKSIIIYKIIYSQRTQAREIEYILTTTRKWGRPLEQAEFIVRIPKTFQLVSLTFPYNYRKNENDINLYYINKENFIPEQNLIVKWVELKVN